MADYDYRVIDALDDVFLALNSTGDPIQRAAGRASSLKRAGFDTSDLDDKLAALREAFTGASAALDVIRQQHLHRKPEPPDGSILLGDDIDERGPGSLFRRDDAGARKIRERANEYCHWLDYAAREWIEWRTAQERGANPGRRLTEETPAADTASELALKARGMCCPHLADIKAGGTLFVIDGDKMVCAACHLGNRVHDQDGGEVHGG